MFSKFSIWRKPLNVGVLGPPGAGKTSLLYALMARPPEDALPSTRGLKLMKMHVEGHSVRFMDLPSRGYGRYTGEIAKLSPSGFIIVVAYGYHSTRIFGEVAEEDLEARLAIGRKTELALLEHQFDACLRAIEVRSTRNVDWVMTIVNKADLWWDQKTKVERFYHNEFRRRLLSVIKRYPRAEKAMPITKYFSCRMQRFFNAATPSVRFDDDDRWELNDGLQNALAEAVDYSKDKA